MVRTDANSRAGSERAPAPKFKPNKFPMSPPSLTPKPLRRIRQQGGLFSIMLDRRETNAGGYRSKALEAAREVARQLRPARAALLTRIRLQGCGWFGPGEDRAVHTM